MASRRFRVLHEVRGTDERGRRVLLRPGQVVDFDEEMAATMPWALRLMGPAAEIEPPTKPPEPPAKPPEPPAKKK